MNVHVTIDWASPKAYFRRRDIAAVMFALTIRLQLAWIAHRERRDIRRLQAASRDMPAYLRRDIGLP